MKKYLLLIMLAFVTTASFSETRFGGSFTKAAAGIGIGSFNDVPGINIEATVFGITCDYLASWENFPPKNCKDSGIKDEPNYRVLLAGYEFPIITTSKGTIKIAPMCGLGSKEYFELQRKNGLPVTHYRELDFRYGGKIAFHFDHLMYASIKGFTDGVSFSIGFSLDQELKIRKIDNDIYEDYGLF